MEPVLERRLKQFLDEHPEIEDQEEIASALKIPNKILSSDRDESVAWYFFYKKERREFGPDKPGKFMIGAMGLPYCYTTWKIKPSS